MKRCCTKRCAITWRARGAAPLRPRRGMRWPGRARNCGSRRVPDALACVGITRTVLLVDNSASRNLELSSRNLEGVKLVASRDVNVYDLLGHNQVLLSEAAAQKLSEALA